MLGRAGFVITEHTFEYSAFPAAWATPIAGVIAALTAIALFVGRGAPVFVAAAIVTLIASLVVLAMLGQRGVLDFPLMRRRGVNLEAVRGDPAVWLVAHIDSKWQPISMIARVIGVVGTTFGLVAMTVLAIMPVTVSLTVASTLLMLTWLAAAPLMLSIVGDKNTGALDNASGVAAVLEAAERLSPDTRIGVLITDGEEMALAGARAWARLEPPAVALNCDSVDDEGMLTVMYSGLRPPALTSALAKAAAAEGEALRVIRLIPGVLTDSVALANAGWTTVTLSRGNLRTLSRVHTTKDTLDSMRGTGISSAARVLARTATELG